MTKNTKDNLSLGIALCIVASLTLGVALMAALAFMSPEALQDRSVHENTNHENSRLYIGLS